MRVKIRQRGQLTLPKPLRQSYNLRTNSYLTIIPIGNFLVLSKRPSLVSQLQQTAKKELVNKGVTLREILDDLKTIRSQYNARKYGLGHS